MNKEINMKTMDGNEACATVAYHFTDISAIYPITPSSPMSEKVDEWSALGRKNMFGQRVRLIEMQSEGGAAGAVHGAAESGALATTFTSSQGLLLMIPNLHILAGHRMPSVFHVAARSVAQHANNIFGDHQDVMDCRATGSIMFSSASVQEVMDLSAIAHLTTIKARIPFIHFFDGFRTSHEIQKIEMIDLEAVEKLLDNDALDEFHKISMNPEHPLLRTTVQGPDVYFQSREANNLAYENVPRIVEGYLSEINKITGRDYHLFNYYGAADAEKVIVIMGSACETAKEVVDFLRKKDQKVGMVQIHLYRPFDMKYFLSQIPRTAKYVTAMDRSAEPGAIAGPVYLDVVASFANTENAPKVFGGRYGLASKDVSPGQIKAVFDNMSSKNPKRFFTIGIVDDVTFLSLDVDNSVVTALDDTISCKFWGLGGDGTVGANKNSAKIIGDYAGMYTQAYFEYDSKKSLGITKSHLRFSKRPIQSTYLITAADFLACHEQAYIIKCDIIHELKEGGTFLLNTSWKVEELEEKLPADVKRELAKRKIAFYTIDAKSIANELGLGNHANIILQAAFFRLSRVMSIDSAIEYMKEAVVKTYSRKGEDVVNNNLTAIDAGVNNIKRIKIPERWANCEDEKKVEETLPKMVKEIAIPCQRQRGNDIPVSAFVNHADGTYELGVSKYDKRGIASEIPIWNPSKCVQCNRCSFVCPHAAIRAFLLDEKEMEYAPVGFDTLNANGAQGYRYSIQISSLDCTGCGSCANVCPAKEKALRMASVTDHEFTIDNWEYAMNLREKAIQFKRNTLKGSQFYQPLLEFSGACAGCGETPYAKLLTQLYGEKVYWVNGVGCSLAWGGDFPSIPYTKNGQGRGPAFYGTLFEDQAENGLGLVLGVEQRREAVKMQVETLLTITKGEVKQSAIKWLDSYDSLDTNDDAAQNFIAVLNKNSFEGRAKECVEQILRNKDMLGKKVVWLFGGDGWAYDIGFGGLDHVIASGEDINIMVVDTEMYSNTGGQASKATPIGASARFADSGKRTTKKDLGRMMMTYPNTYVASVSMGADSHQLLCAITEAVAHKGPSLVLCYAPCINHGIREGMSKVQNEMKAAVECGLWPLYRYDPNKRERPFTLDYKEPKKPVREFLEGQERYYSLMNRFPELAEKLFEEAQQDATNRYRLYLKLEAMYNG